MDVRSEALLPLPWILQLGDHCRQLAMLCCGSIMRFSYLMMLYIEPIFCTFITWLVYCRLVICNEVCVPFPCWRDFQKYCSNTPWIILELSVSQLIFCCLLGLITHHTWGWTAGAYRLFNWRPWYNCSVLSWVLVFLFLFVWTSGIALLEVAHELYWVYSITLCPTSGPSTALVGRHLMWTVWWVC